MQTQIKITIAKEMHTKIKEAAEKNVRSISMQVNYMIQEYFFMMEKRRKENK